jgi:hypothetical protein
MPAGRQLRQARTRSCPDRRSSAPAGRSNPAASRAPARPTTRGRSRRPAAAMAGQRPKGVGLDRIVQPTPSGKAARKRRTCRSTTEVVSEERRAPLFGDQLAARQRPISQRTVLVAEKSGEPVPSPSCTHTPPQCRPVDLAVGRERQRVDPAHSLGRRCAGSSAANQRFRRSSAPSPFRHRDQHDPLPEPLVLDPKRRAILDRAARHRRFLDLAWADPVARHLDHRIVAARGCGAGRRRRSPPGRPTRRAVAKALAVRSASCQ